MRATAAWVKKRFQFDGQSDEKGKGCPVWLSIISTSCDHPLLQCKSPWHCMRIELTTSTSSDADAAVRKRLHTCEARNVPIMPLKYSMSGHSVPVWVQSKTVRQICNGYTRTAKNSRNMSMTCSISTSSEVLESGVASPQWTLTKSDAMTLTFYTLIYLAAPVRW